jgi:hypothetical protein
LEYFGVDGIIILKSVFKKRDGRTWTALIWLTKGKVAGPCACGNEPSGSVKCGKFVDYLRTSGRTLLHAVN